MTRFRPRTHGGAALAALALAVCIGPGPASGVAQAADGTCVGQGEFKRIRGGMTIEKLNQVLDGQTPFADVAGKGNKRTRWYVACEAWQPDKDVAVRYHQPVVGRRTVVGKKLEVYVAA